MNRTIPIPRWITPKRLALASLFAVMALLFWPDSAHAPSAAEEAGYRVAKRLPSLRRQNAETLRALEAAKLATDAQLSKSKLRISTAAARIQNLVDSASSVSVDTVTNTATLGPVFPNDTLIPVRVVRVKVAEFMDALGSEIATLEGAVMMERGRASLAIQSLQATIAAQDTIITGLRAELTRKVPPWYKRASKGVVAMGAGVGCGAATYVLLGPAGGIGGAVLCSAIAGVRR